MPEGPFPILRRERAGATVEAAVVPGGGRLSVDRSSRRSWVMPSEAEPTSSAVGVVRDIQDKGQGEVRLVRHIPAPSAILWLPRQQAVSATG
jgi:hypothetical protein